MFSIASLSRTTDRTFLLQRPFFFKQVTNPETLWNHHHISYLSKQLNHPSILNHRSMSVQSSSSTKSSDYIVWVDLEMTGLDLKNDHIIEMACMITDGELNVVAQSPDIVIHQSDEVLNTMNDWCKKQHGASGLTEQVRQSQISISQAHQLMVNFISKHVVPGTAPLAGNSIHVDRKFLEKEMPRFVDLLHYRILDVSTVKVLCQKWFPEEFSQLPAKPGSHRALDDILESIKELKWYKNHVFRKI